MASLAPAEKAPTGKPLKVGSPHDPAEREADRIADILTAPEEPAMPVCTACAAGGAPCAACGGRDGGGVLRRQRAAGGDGGSGGEMVAPPSVHRVLSEPGEPLPAGIRGKFERRLGADLGGVRVHTSGAPAIESTNALDALAYTAGSDIVLAQGALDPVSLKGRHLLAHEITHVVQQKGAPDASVVQRQPIPGGGSGGRNTTTMDSTADKTARTAGPCGVDVGSLSNEGLLFQLNRARVYRVQNDPHTEGSTADEGAYYDYGNLLRRLTRERRRRIQGGHVWLAEPGQLHPPEQVYLLIGGESLQVQVYALPGSTVAGNFTAGAATFLSRWQFENFLAQRNIPTETWTTLLEGEGRDRVPGEAAAFNLPVRMASRPVFVRAPVPINLLGTPGLSQSTFLGPSLFPGPLGNPTDPFGFNDPFGLNPRGAANGFPTFHYEQQQYIPQAVETLDDLRRWPGSVSSSGPESLWIPSLAQPAVGDAPMMAGDPFLDSPGRDSDFPSGVGGSGFLYRPGVMPDGTTGFMWEGSHVTDIVFINGRPISRGFRAPFKKHAMDFLSKHRSRSTAELNVGTPGSYANDWFFPYAGEVWGRSSDPKAHWNEGSVMIVDASGKPVPFEILEMMACRAPDMLGAEYRFSPPDPGSRSYDAAMTAAHAEAQRRGLPGFCPAGGANCANVPFDIHQAAVGGADLTFEGLGGTIDVSKPENASARRMIELMNQPPEFWAACGMERVPIGPRMWGSAGTSAGLGMGMQFASDMYAIHEGRDVAWGRNMVVAGGFNVGAHFAEEAANTSLVLKLATPRMAGGFGLGGSSAAMTSRVVSSTGVAVIVAPAMTGSIMAIDPTQDYTKAEYAGAMGRTIVPAAGSALASIATGAAIGTAGGPIGIIIGIGVGFVVYKVIDLAVGEQIEEEILEGMGERGCSGGVGPGR